MDEIGTMLEEAFASNSQTTKIQEMSQKLADNKGPGKTTTWRHFIEPVQRISD